MKKSIIGIAVLAVASLFVTVGCGGKKSDVISVGTILPISGPVSAYGIQARDAMLMAFEEINNQGGVLGKKLALIVEDDENSPEKTTNAFKKLTSKDKANIIIGGMTSKCTLAITTLAQAKGVLLITPTSTNDTVTDAGDMIFRSCYNDSFQGIVMGQYAVDTLKAKSVAVLYDISNDYSVGLADSFKKKIESMGAKLVSMESYSAGDKDFNAQLTKIKASAPEALFIPDYYSTISLVAKQIRAQGIMIPILGADGWDEITNNAGDEALNGFYCNHYSSDSTDEKVQTFVNAFKAKYNGQSPNALAALSYDAAYLVAEAIKNAGTADDTKKIRDAMAALNVKLTTGTITFDAKRNPVKSAVILEIVKGADSKLTVKYAGTVNP